MIKIFIRFIFTSLDKAVLRIFNKRRSLDYERFAYIKAAQESADFMLENMNKATNLITRDRLLSFSVEQVQLDGLWLEFGVHQGASIRQIANMTDSTVYGFDSFEGLPEDWTFFQKKGRFSLDGKEPEKMPSNVDFVKGWFNETLPGFIKSHPESVAFLHIDSDLYSSAVTILTNLKPQIKVGTIILFDELLNYPGWQSGEYQALVEFSQQSACTYEYIGFASSGHSVAVRITSI